MALNALTSIGARRSLSFLKYVAENPLRPRCLWPFRDFIANNASSISIKFSKCSHCIDEREGKVLVERRDSVQA